MEASDMLDVLHYLMEEDSAYATIEQVKMQSNVRSTIYKTVYEREYAFKYEESSPNNYGSGGASGDFQDPEDASEYVEPVNPFSPKRPDNVDEPIKGPTKPYVPPTNFDPTAANPFQGTLREPPLR